MMKAASISAPSSPLGPSRVGAMVPLFGGLAAAGHWLRAIIIYNILLPAGRGGRLPVDLQLY